MRTIKKRPVPGPLQEWRQARQQAADPELYPFTYEAMRRTPAVRSSLEDDLFAEQGGLCAYTGREILRNGAGGEAGFHIEHLKSQTHCSVGEDTDYQNMVACWPAPNQKTATEYGAVRKDKWPAPAEAGLFVSPLHPGCSGRFTFTQKQDPPEAGKKPGYSNWMEASSPPDSPAQETIERLNLNHHELRALRSEAITGTLEPINGQFLSLEQMEVIAVKMDQAEQELDAGSNVNLDRFCFAIRQALERRITKLKVLPPHA